MTGSAGGVERRVTVGERASGEPVTLDTRFDCASLTKAVTTERFHGVVGATKHGGERG